MPPRAPDPELEEQVVASAEKYMLDPDILHRMIVVESSWDPEAVSKKGARGLGQFMGPTAQELGVDPSDTSLEGMKKQIDAAAKYLRWLLNRPVVGGDYVRALAAYNWGIGNLEGVGGDLSRVPLETQKHIVKMFGPDAASIQAIENTAWGKRALDPASPRIRNEDGSYSSVRTATAQFDDERGSFVALYPTVRKRGDKLVQLSGEEARREALSRGDYVRFSGPDAQARADAASKDFSARLGLRERERRPVANYPKLFRDNFSAEEMMAIEMADEIRRLAIEDPDFATSRKVLDIESELLNHASNAMSAREMKVFMSFITLAEYDPNTEEGKQMGGMLNNMLLDYGQRRQGYGLLGQAAMALFGPSGAIPMMADTGREHYDKQASVMPFGMDVVPNTILDFMAGDSDYMPRTLNELGEMMKNGFVVAQMEDGSEWRVQFPQLFSDIGQSSLTIDGDPLWDNPQLIPERAGDWMPFLPKTLGDVIPLLPGWLGGNMPLGDMPMGQLPLAGAMDPIMLREVSRFAYGEVILNSVGARVGGSLLAKYGAPMVGWGMGKFTGFLIRLAESTEPGLSKTIGNAFSKRWGRDAAGNLVTDLNEYLAKRYGSRFFRRAMEPMLRQFSDRELAIAMKNLQAGKAASLFNSPQLVKFMTETGQLPKKVLEAIAEKGIGEVDAWQALARGLHGMSAHGADNAFYKAAKYPAQWAKEAGEWAAKETAENTRRLAGEIPNTVDATLQGVLNGQFKAAEDAGRAVVNRAAGLPPSKPVADAAAQAAGVADAAAQRTFDFGRQTVVRDTLSGGGAAGAPARGPVQGVLDFGRRVAGAAEASVGERAAGKVAQETTETAAREVEEKVTQEAPEAVAKAVPKSVQSQKDLADRIREQLSGDPTPRSTPREIAAVRDTGDVPPIGDIENAVKGLLTRGDKPSREWWNQMLNAVTRNDTELSKSTFETLMNQMAKEQVPDDLRRAITAAARGKLAKPKTITATIGDRMAGGEGEMDVVERLYYLTGKGDADGAAKILVGEFGDRLLTEEGKKAMKESLASTMGMDPKEAAALVRRAGTISRHSSKLTIKGAGATEKTATFLGTKADAVGEEDVVESVLKKIQKDYAKQLRSTDPDALFDIADEIAPKLDLDPGDAMELLQRARAGLPPIEQVPTAKAGKKVTDPAALQKALDMVTGGPK